MEYTGFLDINGEAIYCFNKVLNEDGKSFIVEHDSDLGYIIRNTDTNTIEQLNQHNSPRLLVVRAFRLSLSTI